MKTFPILDVGSCATGRLMSDVGGIYDVLGYVLGDDLASHQLPGASSAADPILRAQFPWLYEMELPAGGGSDFTDAVAQIIDTHGFTLDVKSGAEMGIEPIWVDGNAMQDLVDIAGKRMIVTLPEPGDKADVLGQAFKEIHQAIERAGEGLRRFVAHLQAQVESLEKSRPAEDGEDEHDRPV